jgi:uncharacterized protein
LRSNDVTADRTAKKTDSRGVAAYLAIAFGLAWVVWSIPLLAHIPVQSGLFRIFALIAAFAPALACIVTRKWVTREGFADAGLAPNLRRWPYYVAALLIPLAAAFLIAGTAALFGVAKPDLSLGIHASNNPLPVFVFRLTVFAIVLAPVLWGEEFGWRGYLQLRIFPNAPLLAAIITGLIWGVWHYPLLLAGTELPQHVLLILLLFPLGTIFYSILFGWLWLKSGSVWVTSLSHSAMNNLRSPLIAALFWAVPDKLGLTLVGLAVFGVIAGVIVLCGGLKSATQAPAAPQPGLSSA